MRRCGSCRTRTSASRRSSLTSWGGCSRGRAPRSPASGRSSFGGCRSGCRAPSDRASSRATLPSTSRRTSSSRSCARRAPSSATPVFSARTTPTGPSPPTSTRRTAPASSASPRASPRSSPRGRSSPPNTATSSRRSPSRRRTVRSRALVPEIDRDSLALLLGLDAEVDFPERASRSTPAPSYVPKRRPAAEGAGRTRRGPPSGTGRRPARIDGAERVPEPSAGARRPAAQLRLSGARAPAATREAARRARRRPDAARGARDAAGRVRQGLLARLHGAAGAPSVCRRASTTASFDGSREMRRPGATRVVSTRSGAARHGGRPARRLPRRLHDAVALGARLLRDAGRIPPASGGPEHDRERRRVGDRRMGRDVDPSTALGAGPRRRRDQSTASRSCTSWCFIRPSTTARGAAAEGAATARKASRGSPARLPPPAPRDASPTCRASSIATRGRGTSARTRIPIARSRRRRLTTARHSRVPCSRRGSIVSPERIS